MNNEKNNQMLLSMTGFGKARHETDDLLIDIEIKSLNSKTLDLILKTNIPLGELEVELQNYLSEKLFRGRIELIIKILFKNKPPIARINQDIFMAYYQQLTEIADKLNKDISTENIFGHILRLPNIMETTELDIVAIKKELFFALSLAIEQVNNFRRTEGQALEKDIINNLEYIELKKNQIQNYEQQRLENTRKRLKQALENADIQINNERFEAELIYYLEKYDINEEKIRLQSHIDLMRQTINEPNCGKKLNFIAQELNREINTIGSKANNFDIQRLVVEMKEYCEKIKEQTLNIL